MKKSYLIARITVLHGDMWQTVQIQENVLIYKCFHVIIITFLESDRGM